MALVDLNLLRALDALVSTESVAVSAGLLRITPAAASNALRRLRDHFGDPLLVRVGSRLSRTTLAEQLREPAAQAMRAATQALSFSPSFEPTKATGAIRVATSDHVDAVWLEALRRRFEKVAPGLEVLLLPYSADASRGALEGEIDLVIAPRTRFGAALRVVHFVNEPYALVLREAHPSARRRIDVDELVALSHLVVSPSGDLYETAVDRVLSTLGRRRRVVRRVTSFSSGLLMVATSDLVAVVPRSFASVHASRLELRLRALPLEVPPGRLDLGWSPQLHDDPVLTFVRRELAALARSRIDST